MTDDEIRKALALENCTVTPGSYVDRFVRDMVKTAKESPEYGLSERTSDYLDKLYLGYRKQLARLGLYE